MAIYLSHDSDKKVLTLAQALEFSDEGKLNFSNYMIFYIYYFIMLITFLKTL
jgi:hypothetical protein